MSMELKPNLSVTDASIVDGRCILFLKTLLPDNLVDCRQLQEGGTMLTIDGYIDFICPDGTAREKIVVQIKHLTYPEKDGDVYYDIPQSIYAYAERHKGEIVVFIVCDYDNKRFYWRYINEASIEEFKKKSGYIQQTARYHFHDWEKCSASNVTETIGIWRELYNKKMESIRDERFWVEQFASRQKLCFNSVSSELHGVRNSHIVRHQVEEIQQWINIDHSDISKNICLLVGDAGVGKSAVVKDLISLDENRNVSLLCIKADYIDEQGNFVTLEKIQDALAYYSAQSEKVILIVDQIDALSQSFTNDRKHLNMMMTTLLSLGGWSNVRAVVSCRKYDLEYDVILNRIKDKSMIIELGELTEEEVVIALNNLEEGLGRKVDDVTIQVLRTVQMLDSFSILFQRNKTLINFNSQIELYDALWNSVVCDSSSAEEIRERECFLFKLVDTIRSAGTLNPQFIPISDLKRANEYLASNGIVRREGRAVSFFHQSFYEYTLARHYSKEGRLFADDVKKDVQGLELRSTVKAVMDFKRGHDVVKFVEEARSFLSDRDIRLHLKLLTVSVLAFVEKPSRGEKQLITDCCLKNDRLLMYFLRGVYFPNWYPTIKKMIGGIITSLKENTPWFTAVVSCLSRYVYNHPDEVYDMVQSIEDVNAKSFAVACLMREHNDYSKARVLQAFVETRKLNIYYMVDMVLDAVQSNENFAFEELENLISNFLRADSSYQGHDKYQLVNTLCPKLLKAYPLRVLYVLHRCVCQIVKEKAYFTSWGFTMTPKLNNMVHPDRNVDKLLKMYETLLIRFSFDESQVRPMIEHLLLLNDKFTLIMAFTAMAEAPQLYDDIIRLQLIDRRKMDAFLDSSVNFYILKLLRAWYDTLDRNDAVWYQNYILAFESESDFKYDAESSRRGFLCPDLWRHKWMLICNTLPENSLLPNMKRCSQELIRRFNTKLIVEKNDFSCTVSRCGAVVDSETYDRWPMSNWLSSFLKLNTKYKPISLHEHAKEFKKCVRSHPNKFFNFVWKICSRDDILDMYKMAGIEGLIEGGSNPYALWTLAKPYITEEYACADYFGFLQVAEYYIKEDNACMDEIMNVCKNVVLLPFPMVNDLFIGKNENCDMGTKVSDMFSRAINSHQGSAAKLLVKMCAIRSRRPVIYKFFADISSIMHPCLKVIPLYYLFMEAYFDEELFFPLMQSLLSGMGPEALYLQPAAIQWCIYHRKEFVNNYIERIEQDSVSYELLAQIYFYGMVQSNYVDECEKQFERILALNDKKIVAKLLEIAMRTCECSEYRELCIKLIERFASDDRKEVVQAYCSYCECLPVDAFPWFCDITRVRKRQDMMNVYSQLRYVRKCISTYPVECYKFISNQKYYEVEDWEMVDDKVIKILLEIYKKMSLDENEDAINEVLDLFDEYIYRDNRIMKNAVSLLL